MGTTCMTGQRLATDSATIPAPRVRCARALAAYPELPPHPSAATARLDDRTSVRLRTAPSRCLLPSTGPGPCAAPRKAPGQFPGWGAFRPGSCSCRRSAFAWPHRHRPQALFSPHSCRLQGDMESAFHVARDVHINLKVRRMAVELGEHGVTLV